MTEDGFLGIRPAGWDMESFCCSCGDPLLISPGDVVHFKRGGEVSIMGLAVPIPEGLLCSVCNKRENGDDALTVKFARLSCSLCGGELPGGIEPDFDKEGNLKEMFCEDCSEPWRKEV
jgi:hypothetical protein